MGYKGRAAVGTPEKGVILLYQSLETETREDSVWEADKMRAPPPVNTSQVTVWTPVLQSHGFKLVPNLPLHLI